MSSLLPHPEGHPANPPSEALLDDRTELVKELPPRPQRLSAAPAVRRRPRPDWPTVPGYEILGELGTGRIGVVYKARQLSLNRIVALKMLPAGTYADPRQRERLRSEAAVLGQLQHRQIVQVYEVGEQDGQPYLTLEYMRGGSLAARLARSPLPARPAASLVAALAGAVHSAHERGIIHGDLKPANILLAADPHPQTLPGTTRQTGPAREPALSSTCVDLRVSAVKISDFGLPKQLGLDAGQTPSREVPGAPGYMAPEQARGDVEEICVATDVYALGAILYELLTGRPPFRAATPLETARQVLVEEPVPPGDLQPRVPHDLETICLKCLRKEPRQRYASAEALAEDLRAFLAGRPIQARAVSPVERLAQWGWRKPLLASLALGLLVALLAGLAGVR